MNFYRSTKLTGGLFFVTIILLLLGCNSQQPIHSNNNSEKDSIVNNKIVIYQMMTRLFGNKNTNNKYYGSIEENGAGKFNDINDTALDSLKTLGITHIWYTGIIEHATMTDYSKYGIKPDDPDVVKGRAGSGYAIKDYYDVDPDLAADVKNRMQEFEALVKRTHQHGLKVLIDFVPNHVSRTYNSDVKSTGIKNFGEDDDKTKSFSLKNDFYYLPGKSFIVPAGINAGGDDFKNNLKDGKFAETPAKATGNNVFSNAPKIDDWYETVKLNYGVDYADGEKKYFEPMPPVWGKMCDILLYWTNKGVDGFRCDMAEMVPVEFWNWVIPQVKKVNPQIVFIAEAYNPKVYTKYLNEGKFNFLYDKVGLYDTLKRLIKNEPNAYVSGIAAAHDSVKGYNNRMVSFLENHDEERIASKGFAGNPWNAVPAMVVSATISGGPVMIYFGQEAGEKAEGKEGFGGDDNRTTMFDYWGVPAHQRWMNGGKFDGGLLNEDQKRLRDFYSRLLMFCKTNDAIQHGECSILKIDEAGDKVFAFIRYTQTSLVLIATNFDRQKNFEGNITMPHSIMDKVSKRSGSVADLLSGATMNMHDTSISVKVSPMNALVLEIK